VIHFFKGSIIPTRFLCAVNTELLQRRLRQSTLGTYYEKGAMHARR
jgi:hypothetical protein